MIRRIILGASVLLPSLTLAADNIQQVLGIFGGLINAVIPLIIGLAVVGFLWGLVQYLIAKSPEDQKTARGTMFWGIVILFVMVSVWGLVGILGGTFGIDQGGGPEGIPGFQ